MTRQNTKNNDLFTGLDTFSYPHSRETIPLNRKYLETGKEGIKSR